MLKNVLNNKVVLISFSIVAAYLLLGFLAAPLWLKPVLERNIQSLLGRELRFESLHVDPTVLSFRMTGVELAEAERPLWPGVEFRAGVVQGRMNFWQLRPAISELLITEPVISIVNSGATAESGSYSFVSLLHEFRLNRPDADFAKLNVEQWQTKNGVLMQSSATGAADEILLSEISLDAGPADTAKQREFQFESSLAGGESIGFQGLLDTRDWSAAGSYQFNGMHLPAFPAGSQLADNHNAPDSGIELKGTFEADMQTDWLMLALSDSHFRSSNPATCVFDGLLCAAASTLQGRFAGLLNVGTHGWLLDQAKISLDAFSLDSILAVDQIQLAKAVPVESLEIQLGPAFTGERDGTLEFILENGQQGQLKGQFNSLLKQADIEFTVRGEHALDGRLQLQTLVSQQTQSVTSQLDLQLLNPDATLAAAFIRENLGAQITASMLELVATMVMEGEELSLAQAIRLDDAGLVQAPTLDAESGPALLLALLQDPTGGVLLELVSDPLDVTAGTHVSTVLQQAVLENLGELAEQPYEMLAELAGTPGLKLNQVRFEPGSAALGVVAKQHISALAQALLQRPGLALELTGSYDPMIDRKDLQIEQVRTHIALAMAAGLSFQTGAEPPDFSDPKVHSIIDEFAGRQLPPRVLDAFSAHYGQANADQGIKPDGEVTDYYAALFEILVEFAEVPESALTTLARFRSQAVRDDLAKQGVNSERVLATGKAAKVAASVDGVPLAIDLHPLSPSEEPTPLLRPPY